MGQKHLGERNNFIVRLPVAINNWLSENLGKGRPSKNAKITVILENAMKTDKRKKLKEQEVRRQS